MTNQKWYMHAQNYLKEMPWAVEFTLFPRALTFEQNIMLMCGRVACTVPFTCCLMLTDRHMLRRPHIDQRGQLRKAASRVRKSAFNRTRPEQAQVWRNEVQHYMGRQARPLRRQRPPPQPALLPCRGTADPAQHHPSSAQLSMSLEGDWKGKRERAAAASISPRACAQAKHLTKHRRVTDCPTLRVYCHQETCR